MCRFLASRRFLISSIMTPATVNPLPSPSIMDGQSFRNQETGSVLLIVINGCAEGVRAGTFDRTRGRALTREVLRYAEAVSSYLGY